MQQRFLSAVLLLALTAVAAADQPADFEARLEVHKNGKLFGETLFSLSRQDGRWIMRSKTEATRGVASWIGGQESARGEGDWLDGRPRPIHFERTVQIIKKMRWTADFDWEAGVAHTVYPDGESHLELEPGVLDEQSLGLAIRQGLRKGEDEWFFRQVDEDEIEDVHFRVSGVEDVQTALGCMTAHAVEKVRAPTSKRYTRTYYAAEYDFTPIRMEHGKHGEEHYEGWVTSLSVNGKTVTAGPDCPQ